MKANINTPLISVIIPCFNYGKYLTETVNSLIAQTYPNWECIIVNDGSTDNTEEIANDLLKNDKRLKVFSQDNKGRSEARNLGLQKATGEYIQFLDADDLLHRLKFERQINAFINHPATDIVYSDFLFFNINIENVIITNHFCKEMSDPLREILFEFGSTGFIIPIHCALIKRDILSKTETFPIGIEGREDYIFWIDLAMAGFKFFYLNEKLAFYRKHNESTSHNTLLVDFFMYKTSYIVYDRIPNSLKDEYSVHCANKFSEILQAERSKLKKKQNSKFQKLKKLINRFTT